MGRHPTSWPLGWGVVLFFLRFYYIHKEHNISYSTPTIGEGNLGRSTTNMIIKILTKCDNRVCICDAKEPHYIHSCYIKKGNTLLPHIYSSYITSSTIVILFATILFVLFLQFIALTK
jgi:hypothetical protein